MVNDDPRESINSLFKRSVTRRRFIEVSAGAVACASLSPLLPGCGSTDTGSLGPNTPPLGTGTPKPVSEPVFFVHISDTHLDTKTLFNNGLSDDGKVDLTKSGKALMTALFTKAIPVIKPHATIHTGDVTNKGYIKDSWDTYSNLLKSSNLAAYTQYVDTIGNHDLKVEFPFLSYEDGFKNFLDSTESTTRYGYTTVDTPKGTVRLIRTNTAGSTLLNPSDRNKENIYGCFPESQQQDLLYNHPDRNQTVVLNIVLGHSPVVANYAKLPSGYSPGDTLDTEHMYQITDGNGRMKQLIVGFNAPIYLSGHVHNPGLEWLSNKTLVVKADTFGLHGTESSFYLVAYDFEVMSPAAKLVDFDVTTSPAWPIVFITAPVNSSLGNTDSSLGNVKHIKTEPSYTAGNPNATPFATEELPMLRVMVFSPSENPVTTVTYSLAGGAFDNNLTQATERLWETSLNLQGLTSGTHTVAVRATLSHGQIGIDTISITVS